MNCLDEIKKTYEELKKSEDPILRKQMCDYLQNLFVKYVSTECIGLPEELKKSILENQLLNSMSPLSKMKMAETLDIRIDDKSIHINAVVSAPHDVYYDNGSTEQKISFSLGQDVETNGYYYSSIIDRQIVENYEFKDLIEISLNDNNNYEKKVTNMVYAPNTDLKGERSTVVRKVMFPNEDKEYSVYKETKETIILSSLLADNMVEQMANGSLGVDGMPIEQSVTENTNTHTMGFSLFHTMGFMASLATIGLAVFGTVFYFMTR